MPTQSANLRTFPKVLLAWLGERSAEAAAPVLGVAPNTLRNWLTGDCLPPATKLPALATALGVPEPKLRLVIARDRARRHGATASSASIGAPASTTPVAPAGVRS